MESSMRLVRLFPPAAVAALLCCLLLPSCDKSPLAPSIVGKWQSDANSGNAIEFFPDGTLRETAPLKNSNGKYALLDGGRMKTETDGILWGTNVATWKYSLSGNKLTMTVEGGAGITLNWTRMQ